MASESMGKSSRQPPPTAESPILYQYDRLGNESDLPSLDLWRNWERDPGINGQRWKPASESPPPQMSNSPRIRILHLLPGQSPEPLSSQLLSHALGDDPDYEALSYTWGDPEKTHLVACGDRSIGVNRNAYDALIALRDPVKPRRLWIDAICINQEDNDEKSIQVQLMGEIYARARRVLIWLGAETEQDCRALEAVRVVREYVATDVYPPTVRLTIDDVEKLPGFPQNGWEHIYALLSRPWFTRLWVLQEVVKAQYSTCILGGDSVPYEHLATVVAVLAGSVPTHDPRTLGKSVGYFSTLLVRTWRENNKTTDGTSYLDILIGLERLSVTDPRDRLYAVLDISHVEDEWVPLPNYNLTSFEVFRDFAAFDITHNKRLESLFWAPLGTHDELLQTDVPSWTPNLCDGPGISAISMIYGNCAGGNLPIDATIEGSPPRFLTIMAKQVGRVERLSSSREQFYRTADPPGIPRIWSTISPIAEAEWLDDCLSALLGVNRSALTPYLFFNLPRQEIFARFARTLCCDLQGLCDESHPRDNAPPDESLVNDMMKSLVELKVVAEGVVSVETWDLDMVYRTCIAKALQATNYMQFCYLENGRIGWVPGSARVGDVVVVFDGAYGANVLRPNSDGTYLWVGEGWIYGVMRGEMLEEEGSESRRITIR